MDAQDAVLECLNTYIGDDMLRKQESNTFYDFYNRYTNELGEIKLVQYGCGWVVHPNNILMRKAWAFAIRINRGFHLVSTSCPRSYC